MAINDDTKLDVLWKKVVFGVTETTELKAGPNESVSSPVTVFNEDIYSQSGSIPKPAPSVSDSVVNVNAGVDRIECINDISVANSRTWFAVSNPAQDRDFEISPGAPNALTDWLPPSFHFSYLVKVFAGDPQITGVALNPLATNEEWLFDYKAGTLHFPNNIPSGVSSSGIFIEGFRYVGTRGLASSGSPSTEILFTHTTALLAQGETELIEFQSGGFSTILDLNVDIPSLVIAHGTIDRTDTNPYTFRAISGRLFDDGSFIQGGIRFFGQRYAFVASRDGSGKTYWSITNESSVPAEITINITAANV